MLSDSTLEMDGQHHQHVRECSVLIWWVITNLLLSPLVSHFITRRVGKKKFHHLWSKMSFSAWSVPFALLPQLQLHSRPKTGLRHHFIIPPAEKKNPFHCQTDNASQNIHLFSPGAIKLEMISIKSHVWQFFVPPRPGPAVVWKKLPILLSPTLTPKHKTKRKVLRPNAYYESEWNGWFPSAALSEQSVCGRMSFGCSLSVPCQ